VKGPDHYREAERRLQASDYQWQHSAERGADAESLEAVLGSIREAIMALAHAQLAAAAATAEIGGRGYERGEAWRKVLEP
jgi:hypothetical protein